MVAAVNLKKHERKQPDLRWTVFLIEKFKLETRVHQTSIGFGAKGSSYIVVSVKTSCLPMNAFEAVVCESERYMIGLVHAIPKNSTKNRKCRQKSISWNDAFLNFQWTSIV